jgi:hypothetical protein
VDVGQSLDAAVVEFRSLDASKSSQSVLSSIGEHTSDVTQGHTQLVLSIVQFSPNVDWYKRKNTDAVEFT